MARYITGVLMAVGVVLLILYAPVIYIKGFVVLLSLVACWEFLSIAVKGSVSVRAAGVLCALVGGIVMIFSRELQSVLLFVYVVIFIAFVMQFFGGESTDEKIKRTAFFVLAVLYSVFLFGFIAAIFDRPDYRFLCFLAIACTYLGDTGAYFTGRAFGRHKLARVISPGKTVEGAFGAVAGGMVAAVIVGLLFRPEVHVAMMVGIGAVIAVLGILGDLAESLLKRGFGVKDSGTIIPGHGGILDRLDSLLFTAPFVYFISYYV
ncbi:MAG: phosphatidate cytidylyltransferase [Deltaproteobacteria bacterium]|nr:phosphatidate cytidylyltransferase [Deltaproteobacteria bacterium]